MSALEVLSSKAASIESTPVLAAVYYPLFHTIKHDWKVSSAETASFDAFVTQFGQSNTLAKAQANLDNRSYVSPAVLPDNIDWDSAGLISSLKVVFTAAIAAAFPKSVEWNLDQAVITRCTNPQFGDFQCNNAMQLAKQLKATSGYTSKLSLHCISVMRRKEKKRE